MDRFYRFLSHPALVKAAVCLVVVDMITVALSYLGLAAMAFRFAVAGGLLVLLGLVLYGLFNHRQKPPEL
jgi:hypothetical protein